MQQITQKTTYTANQKQNTGVSSNPQNTKSKYSQVSQYTKVPTLNILKLIYKNRTPILLKNEQHTWKDFQNDDVVIAGNGIFLLKKVPHGNFVFTLEKTTVGTYLNLANFKLTDELHIPRVPRDMFKLLIDMDRYVMATKSNSEFFANIIYNKNTKKFSYHIPKQTVGAGSVEFEEFIATEDKFVALDHHSHNSMGAFFSSTDDENDRKSPFKISLVIGNITKNSYSYKIRKCAYGLFEEISLDFIVEPEPPLSIPTNILKIIESKVEERIILCSTYTEYKTEQYRKQTAGKSTSTQSLPSSEKEYTRDCKITLYGIEGNKTTTVYGEYNTLSGTFILTKVEPMLPQIGELQDIIEQGIEDYIFEKELENPYLILGTDTIQLTINYSDIL